MFAYVLAIVATSFFTANVVYGLTTVVTDTCTKNVSVPCEMIVDVETNNTYGTATLSAESAAPSCESYSVPARPCRQSGLEVESVVTQSGSTDSGTFEIGSSVIVSVGGPKTQSESTVFSKPKSNSTVAYSKKRVICSCTPVESSSTVGKTTVAKTTVVPVKVTVSTSTSSSTEPRADAKVTVPKSFPGSTVVPDEAKVTVPTSNPDSTVARLSDKMSSAFKNAEDSAQSLKEEIKARQSRLAFQTNA